MNHIHRTEDANRVFGIGLDVSFRLKAAGVRKLRAEAKWHWLYLAERWAVRQLEFWSDGLTARDPKNREVMTPCIPKGWPQNAIVEDREPLTRIDAKPAPYTWHKLCCLYLEHEHGVAPSPCRFKCFASSAQGVECNAVAFACFPDARSHPICMLPHVTGAWRTSELRRIEWRSTDRVIAVGKSIG
jgi:hypothetical protein